MTRGDAAVLGLMLLVVSAAMWLLFSMELPLPRVDCC